MLSANTSDTIVPVRHFIAAPVSSPLARRASAPGCTNFVRKNNATANRLNAANPTASVNAIGACPVDGPASYKATTTYATAAKKSAIWMIRALCRDFCATFIGTHASFHFAITPAFSVIPSIPYKYPNCFWMNRECAAAALRHHLAVASLNCLLKRPIPRSACLELYR
jgi:hypothetical protein